MPPSASELTIHQSGQPRCRNKPSARGHQLPHRVAALRSDAQERLHGRAVPHDAVAPGAALVNFDEQRLAASGAQEERGGGEARRREHEHIRLCEQPELCHRLHEPPSPLSRAFEAICLTDTDSRTESLHKALPRVHVTRNDARRHERRSRWRPRRSCICDRSAWRAGGACISGCRGLALERLRVCAKKPEDFRLRTLDPGVLRRRGVLQASRLGEPI
eukprot:27015-Prymnesium_polylepis.1